MLSVPPRPRSSRCTTSPSASAKRFSSARVSAFFASLARAAGYAAVYDFSDLDVFAQHVAHVLEQQGPVFATLHVEPSKPLHYDYPSLYDPEKRKAFKSAWQG